ncbi:unnamed protein product [Blepharisma stoltei]|uniref:Uncharacterized protein n=1 Tax=Blepharisma stoltei TaxID=1481888 RepID=A0AAU9J2P3_9CILI|nr:unnamed protein product [Blepharisma stoltei]
MEDFETDAVRNIMSKIYLTMQENNEDALPHAEEPVPEKIIHASPEPPRSENPQKSTKKIRASDFIKTTYLRMQNKTKKSQEDFKKVKKQVDKERYEEVKKAPEINSNSKKIVGKIAPIQDRVSEMLQEKERKISELKTKLDQDKEELLKKELTFSPQIHGKSDKPRSALEFYKYNEDWANMNNVKKAMKKDELDQKMKQIFKFHPQIDQKSEKIVQESGEKRPPEIRLLERFERSKIKIKEMQQNKEYSFSPVINKKHRQLARTNSAHAGILTKLCTLPEIKVPTSKTPKGTKSKMFDFSPETKSTEVSEQPEPKQTINFDELFDLS